MGFDENFLKLLVLFALHRHRFLRLGSYNLGPCIWLYSSSTSGSVVLTYTLRGAGSDLGFFDAFVAGVVIS